MIEQLGGRKFLLTLIILGVGTFVQLKSGMNAEYAAFLAGILAAFSASNAYVTVKATGEEGASTQASDLARVEAGVTANSIRQDKLEAAVLEAVNGASVAGEQRFSELSATITQVAATAEKASKLATALATLKQANQ